MKILKHSFLLLSFITLFALALRLWQLGGVPISPNWDEAALGYNAYSILQTGRDEHGAFLPVVLESFGDYKPALYSYLIIPFILLFDLSVIAVRLPSVLFGVIAVIATYFLVKELFNNRRVALFSSFLLAISPWHIQFSRVGFEANVGVTFNILAVLFFIKGFKNKMFFTLATVFGALGLYTYQSEKVFLPFLFTALIIIFRHELVNIPKKAFAIPLIAGLIVALPLLVFMITHPESLARAQMTSVISRGDSILERSAERLVIDKERGDLLGQLFNNRRVIYAKTVINGYISHIDPNWLFVTGDLPRHHVPGMGLLYLWELPFVFIGIIALLRLKEKRSTAVIFSWLLIAPIPAAITFDVPHAVRTLNFLPIFQILVAFGLLTSYVFIKQHISFSFVRYAVMGIFALCIAFSFSYYLNQYFVQQNYFFAKDWQYGYKEIISEVESRKDMYGKVIVSSEVPMDQSYIFFLFYLRYPPERYQREAIYHANGTDHAFGQYEFRPLTEELLKRDADDLYVGSERDFPKEAVSVSEIQYPDASVAMKVIPAERLIKLQ